MFRSLVSKSARRSIAAALSVPIVAFVLNETFDAAARKRDEIPDKKYHWTAAPEDPSTLSSQLILRNYAVFCEGRDKVEAHFDFDEKERANKLGEGAYATVHLAKNKKSGENVAIKCIDRAFTSQEDFNREMRTMQYIVRFGGHPNIVSLHKYYQGDDSFFVVMDYVSGGEMFDHLIKNGAYSEADAARLIRQVASALAFLHGIGVVHADMKPENLMLSEAHGNAVVKLVDFGSAQIPGGVTNQAFTPAYAPPETFLDPKNEKTVRPPMDMWAVGVILYIMLVGMHPFEVDEQVSDKELEERIKTNSKPPPIRNSKVTAHLSDSAIELLERLMERNPSKRMTAAEMLRHPWVLGETATADTIQGSDERLSRIRAMKTQLQAHFLQHVLNWSDTEQDLRRQTSLIEDSFKKWGESSNGDDPKSISMAEFHSLLSENMKHKFFPKNHIVYNEGDYGDHMYIINSGTVEVTTSTGSRADRSQGDFFGEGALLHPNGIRSGTIRCKTPVHVIEISREYFHKYLQSSDPSLMMGIKEKHRIRMRNRAKMILQMQDNELEDYKKGDFLYREGEIGDKLWLVDRGLVKVTIRGDHVFTAGKGNFTGEQAVIQGLKRNASAECVSDRCTVQRMAASEFQKLMDLYPDVMAAVREISQRRDLKKAVVLRLRDEFPYSNPIEAFCALGAKDEDDVVTMESLTQIMRDMDPDYSKEEIRELFNIMDLTNSGTISFDEFKKVFIADVKTSASI